MGDVYESHSESGSFYPVLSVIVWLPTTSIYCQQDTFKKLMYQVNKHSFNKMRISGVTKPIVLKAPKCSVLYINVHSSCFLLCCLDNCITNFLAVNGFFIISLMNAQS